MAANKVVVKETVRSERATPQWYKINVVRNEPHELLFETKRRAWSPEITQATRTKRVPRADARGNGGATAQARKIRRVRTARERELPRSPTQRNQERGKRAARCAYAVWRVVSVRYAQRSATQPYSAAYARVWQTVEPRS